MKVIIQKIISQTSSFDHCIFATAKTFLQLKNIFTTTKFSPPNFVFLWICFYQHFSLSLKWTIKLQTKLNYTSLQSFLFKHVRLKHLNLDIAYTLKLVMNEQYTARLMAFGILKHKWISYLSGTQIYTEWK